MARKPTLHGRELWPDDLKAIREQIEVFDTIEHIDDDMRALIEQQWPNLVAKLPVRVRPRRKPGTRAKRPR